MQITDITLALSRQAAGKSEYSVDLSSMMAICETNYWRLLKLLPNLKGETEEGKEFGFLLSATSSLLNEKKLVIRLLESCPYTTILGFYIEGENQTAKQQQWNLLPAMSIRVYHDARMAEVISFDQHRNFFGKYEYPNRQMFQQDEKTQLNLLLAEWLSYCLRYGRTDKVALQLAR